MQRNISNSYITSTGTIFLNGRISDSTASKVVISLLLLDSLDEEEEQSQVEKDKGREREKDKHQETCNKNKKANESSEVPSLSPSRSCSEFLPCY